MSITIYWACIEDEWLRAKRPEPVYKNFIKNINDKTTTVEFCPAIKDYAKNIFSMKSIYDYNFKIDSTDNINSINLKSDMHDQLFFNKHIIIRSAPDKFFSFSQHFVFFTEESSLKMSAGIFPYLEDNDITKKCKIIPGTYDIGKWFRAIEFAFFLKSEYQEFNIKENEIYQYIKFETDKKIIFKQFRANENIKKYLSDIIGSKNSRILKNRLLENYYLMFNHKKQIIKEIKNNLIEKSNNDI